MKTLTKADLLEQIKAGTLDLGHLPSRRLSKTQVVIEVQNKIHVDILSAPLGYSGCNLIDILLHSFTLPAYAVKIGIGEKNRRNQAAYKFFSFLEVSEQLNSADSPNYFVTHPLSFTRWKEHLLAHETSASVWRHMATLLKVLTRTLNQEYGKTSNWPPEVKSAWMLLKSNTPTKPPHEKSPPLGKYLSIPSAVHSENELYMGLRYGTIWLLKKLQAQRSIIFNDPVVAKTIEKYKGSSHSDFTKALAWDIKCSKSEQKNSEIHSLKGTLLAHIQADPLLSEWQCYLLDRARSKLRKPHKDDTHLLSKHLQSELLSRVDHKTGRICKLPLHGETEDSTWQLLKEWIGSTKDLSHMPRYCWWGPDLVTHTALEKLLMVWLLASERAQKSGIEKLTLDSLLFTNTHPKSVQVSTNKQRRATSSTSKSQDTEIVSQIYKERDPPFSVYTGWHQLENNAQTFFTNYNQSNAFLVNAKTQHSGIIVGNQCKHITGSSLPLELIATRGTVWNELFLNESKHSIEAKAFIAIVNNRISEKQKNPNLSSTLSTSPIGQGLVVKQELVNNIDDSLSDIESETAGHNVKTGRNVYKDGFLALGVQELLEPVKSFARRVGDQKIQLAENLAYKMENQKTLVSYSELEKICGIDSSARDQTELLSLLDERDMLTIAGELEINGEILIVETDFTAALMYGYIQHLKENLRPLMESERDGTALKHLSKLIYLDQVFRGFDPSLQEAGRKLADATQFPFPPLS